MLNKIRIVYQDDPHHSTFETGDTVEEFIAQYFESAAAAAERGIRVFINDVEHFLGDVVEDLKDAGVDLFDGDPVVEPVVEPVVDPEPAEEKPKAKSKTA